MTFIRGRRSKLNAQLVHDTGSMIRFRPAQLHQLPVTDTAVTVVLPDGRELVDCRFKRNPANPYIGGAKLVRWIKSWVRWKSSVDVTVIQVGMTAKVRVVAASAATASSRDPARQRRVSTRLARAVAGETGARRRKTYERLERDPELRRLVLDNWPHVCQVRGCTATAAHPADLRKHLLDVHHLNHVSAGGADSPMNVCLICASHHALIHRAGGRLTACDEAQATIDFGGGGGLMKIDRDATILW